ncbi:hypothetical protein VTK56DRAFT_3342 [Thermocarpiscus australiensis]
MPPLIDQAVGLVKRADGCGVGRYRGPDGFCYSYSSWNWWGRWVLTGLAILFFLIVLALLFRNSRRRRRNGLRPMYGTGWMAPPQYYQPPPPQYTPHDQGNVYNPPPDGHKFNQNDGYYGNQEGIELQQPPNTYQRNTNEDYVSPPGPPANATKPNL